MRVLCARSAEGFWWRHHTAGAHEERSRAETREMPTGHKRHHSARLRQLFARGAVSRVQSTFSSCWDEVGEFKLTQDYIRGTYSYTRTIYDVKIYMYTNPTLVSRRCGVRVDVSSSPLSPVAVRRQRGVGSTERFRRATATGGRAPDTRTLSTTVCTPVGLGPSVRRLERCISFNSCIAEAD